MILDEDLVSLKGIRLIPSGQEVTRTVIVRLAQHCRRCRRDRTFPRPGAGMTRTLDEASPRHEDFRKILCPAAASTDLDEAKIAQSFINRSTSDPESAATIRAILNFARQVFRLDHAGTILSVNAGVKVLCLRSSFQEIRSDVFRHRAPSGRNVAEANAGIRHAVDRVAAVLGALRDAGGAAAQELEQPLVHCGRQRLSDSDRAGFGVDLVD